MMERFSPKLFESLYPIRHQSQFAIGIAVVLFFTVSLNAEDRVPFSIYKLPPSTSAATSRSASRVAFSIHRDVAPVTTTSAIQFSIHKAPADPIANVPKPVAEPECGTNREANRILIIVITKPTTETKIVRAANCPDGRCPLIKQSVRLTTDASDQLLTELSKLPKPWKWGAETCNHFEVIDGDSKDNDKLMKELGIKKSELPLLVKECDPIKRQSGKGVTMKVLAATWNNWYSEPKALKAEHGPCVPKVGGDGKLSWTWPGSLREHLIDQRGPHHLPAAVVDRWSFSEQQRFHNWHHDKIEGRIAQTKQTKPVIVKSQPRIYQGRSYAGGIENRIWQIAESIPRSVQPRLGSDVSPKKEPRNFASGKSASVTA